MLLLLRMLLLALTTITLGPLSVACHGHMVWPSSWFDPNGDIGLSLGGFMTDKGQKNHWFSNWTFIPGQPTLDPSLYTVPDFHGDAYKYWKKARCFIVPPLTYDVCKVLYPVDPVKNPWMAPGTAPVFSPCGVYGGNPYGCGGVGYLEVCPGGGYNGGSDARDLHWHQAATTEWVRGGVAEVGWGLLANHGGGYSYRLCKVGVGGQGAVTEDCFQSTPLRFASENSWVQYGWDSGTRVEFKANRTRDGTFPPGSEWTMLPIPLCGLAGSLLPPGLGVPAQRPRVARYWDSRLGEHTCESRLPLDPDGRSGGASGPGGGRLCAVLPMGLRGHTSDMEFLL